MDGKRVCFELLARLENHGSKEVTDTSAYSIEHIMPQNERLSPEWRNMLGEDWRELQQQWLHRLGNLTLTGYNSTYSDRSFDEKKTIVGGFSDSSVRLNKVVRESAVWTPVEMEQRGKELSRRARLIWVPLVVDKSLIDAAAQDEMRALAKNRDVGKVKMTSESRALFDVLRAKIRDLDSNIIELAEQHTVSYHSPDFFLEVLPRKGWINLLLALDFNEVDDPAGIDHTLVMPVL